MTKRWMRNPRQCAARTLQSRRDGIQENGLLGAGVRTQGYRRPCALPRDCTGRRGPQSRLQPRWRGRIFDGEMDRGVDRSHDGLREISRKMLPRGSGPQRMSRARIPINPHRTCPPELGRHRPVDPHANKRFAAHPGTDRAGKRNSSIARATESGDSWLDSRHISSLTMLNMGVQKLL
jgi:hypothetical protein